MAEDAVDRDAAEEELFMAVAIGNMESARRLLADGADATGRASKRGMSKLFVAVNTGRDDMVMLLLEHGADPNYAGEEKLPREVMMAPRAGLVVLPSVLAAAIRAGLWETCAALITCGAKVTKEDMMVCVMANATEFIEVCANTDSLVLHADLLTLAVMRGYVLMVLMLLEHGADPNALSADGTTALYHALMSRNERMVRVLVRAGAKETMTVRGRVLQDMWLWKRMYKQIKEADEREFSPVNDWLESIHMSRYIQAFEQHMIISYEDLWGASQTPHEFLGWMTNKAHYRILQHELRVLVGTGSHAPFSPAGTELDSVWESLENARVNTHNTTRRGRLLSVSDQEAELVVYKNRGHYERMFENMFATASVYIHTPVRVCYPEKWVLRYCNDTTMLTDTNATRTLEERFAMTRAVTTVALRLLENGFVCLNMGPHNWTCPKATMCWGLGDTRHVCRIGAAADTSMDINYVFAPPEVVAAWEVPDEAPCAVAATGAWCLGVTLHFVWCGELPFRRKDLLTAPKDDVHRYMSTLTQDDIEVNPLVRVAERLAGIIAGLLRVRCEERMDIAKAHEAFELDVCPEHQSDVFLRETAVRACQSDARMALKMYRWVNGRITSDVHRYLAKVKRHESGRTVIDTKTREGRALNQLEKLQKGTRLKMEELQKMIDEAHTCKMANAWRMVPAGGDADVLKKKLEAKRTPDE